MLVQLLKTVLLSLTNKNGQKKSWQLKPAFLDKKQHKDHLSTAIPAKNNHKTTIVELEIISIDGLPINKSRR